MPKITSIGLQVGMQSQNIFPQNKLIIRQKNLYKDNRVEAKQQIIAKPLEHVTLVYACVIEVLCYS